MTPEQRLIIEAMHIAEASELARFNAERAQLLRGKPPVQGERMPIAHSGVGGDIPENGG